MEEEIELRELIEILIKKKMTIVIFTLGAMVLAMIYSFIILKPTYQAKMVLMTSTVNNVGTAYDNKTILITSDSGDIDIPKFNSAKIDSILNDMSKYPDMNLETYKQQIKSQSVLSKTIEDLGLEDKYNIESLGTKINLETIKDTPLITIKMEGSDPEEAAEIINTLGDNFVTTITSEYGERENKVFEYVGTQMEIGKREYETALSELKDILSQPRSAKELNLEIESNFAQMTDYKARLNDLEVKSDGQILKIKSKIDDIGKDIQNLQIEYQDREYVESIVRQKRDMAKEVYEYFLSKSEELRLIEATNDSQINISIITRAYPADAPIGPRKALNLAIGTVLGLMIGVFIAFFKEYWDNSSKENTVDGGKIG